MALVNYTGFETGSGTGTGTTVGETWAITGNGTLSVQSSVVRSGDYALKLERSGVGLAHSIALGQVDTNGINLIAQTVVDAYVQFYFRYNVKPASGAEEIFLAQDSGAANKFSIRLDSNGKLNIYDRTDTQIGSAGATTLAQDTWYQIRVRIGTGNPANYEVLIDGVSEFSGTANLSTAENALWLFGIFTNQGSADVTYYYDDIVIYDDAFPSGDLAVLRLVPNANGSTMSWTNGTNTSDYTQVNEVPPDNTEYVMSPTTGNPNIALFDLESCSDVGLTGSIKAFKGFIITRENSSVTSATKIRVHSGSTDSDSSTRNGTTVGAVQSRILETDPDTGVAWTTAGIDAVEVGAVENNAVATRCSTVYGMVLYEPGSAPTATGNMFLVF